MTDQADERLKALKTSMKEALGKLTGSDELEAEGARERAGGGAEPEAVVPEQARAASQPEDAAAHGTKAPPSRRRS